MEENIKIIHKALTELCNVNKMIAEIVHEHSCEIGMLKSEFALLVHELEERKII